MTTKVLIAEDEEAIREELVECLTDDGCLTSAPMGQIRLLA